MTKRLVLIVEDYSGKRMHLRDAAIQAGLHVVECASGDEAMQLWEGQHPDLVLLDLEIRGAQGMEVLRWWQRQDRIPKTKVIVVSGHDELRPEIERMGEVEFWSSPGDVDDLDEKLRKAVGDLPPYRRDPRERWLDLNIAPAERVEARLDAEAPMQSDRLLEIDCEDEHERLQDSLPGANWHSFAQRRGFELHSKLFPRRIEGKYSRALALAEKEDLLHIRLTLSEGCTGAGYELLNQNPRPAQDFIVLKHPFSCRLRDVSPRTTSISRSELNLMTGSAKQLRILLVGGSIATCDGHSPNLIDDEIEFLYVHVPEWFRNRGVRVRMESPLRSKDATVDKFAERLQRQSYDIVHFSGHASNDSYDELNRGIYFRRNSDDHTPTLFTAKHFEGSLRESKIRFFYLNACGTGTPEGADVRPRSRLAGIAHALLKAGVNSVLGHRIPVSDHGASMFARTFYHALAERGELDFAVLEARRCAERDFPNDPIWLSSVLYTQ